MADETMQNDLTHPSLPPRPVINLDPANVPPELHSIIPLAEKWGIQDEALRNKLIQTASIKEMKEFWLAIYPIYWDMVSFGDRYENLVPNELGRHEAGVFDALWKTWHEFNTALRETLPKIEWLVMVGWPDHFRRPPLDPANFPPELQPLIPLAEKWVTNDDYVRDVAIEVAPTEELVELIDAINQVGMRRVSALSVKMGESEAQEREGYTLMELLGMAEYAECVLQFKRDHPIELDRNLRE